MHYSQSFKNTGTGGGTMGVAIADNLHTYHIYN